MKIIIGTRGSELALTQTNMVAEMIKNHYPNIETEIKIIKTTGDINKDEPIGKIGGKEIFIKEIEKELLEGSIDMAVHSMKDMPGVLPQGLKLSFVPKREDPRDVLILKNGNSLDDLPKGAKVGTGSKRRAFQLMNLRPDVEIVHIRGNVQTRISKIESEGLDGVILAAAGIHRLGLELDNMYYFSKEEMIPSPTQGILAIEIKEDNQELDRILMELNDRESEVQARVEREYLNAVGGSCTVPVAAFCKVLDDENIRLTAMLGSENGEKVIRETMEGKISDNLGSKIGQSLKSQLDKKGIVYLVGAGPGDEELISLKGKRAIEEADTIVYDRLANPNLLRYKKPGTKLIYVGKKSADHTKTQDQINDILLEEAREGKVVTRLKGGDPYVFGRGGEEGAYLGQAGIEFEVVPGVTSAIGGLAYAGIPITHRNVATSFHVITGHTQNNDELDYEPLAKLKGTLVFLMGFKNLPNITKGLMENGKSEETPVAIINWATTSRQKVLVGNLGNIYKKVEESDLKPPCLIVVGEVVELRDELNFFEKMPLFGQNIVITREAKRAESTIEKFRRLGANVLSFPMIKTIPIYSPELYSNINELDSFDYIFFTSVNGVNYFFERLLEISDIRKLSKVKFCVIGKKTHAALKKYGIKAELMPDHFEGLEAVEVLKENIRPEDRILVPRARLGRNEIVEELKKYSEVTEIHIYDTVVEEAEKENILDSLEELDNYKLIFTSSSTYTNFKELMGEELENILEKAEIISIGPITTETIESDGNKVDIEAKEYTIDGIIEELKEQNE